MRLGIGILCILLMAAIQPIDAQQPGHRLQRINQYGGATQAVTLDGTDALVAEGDSIVRVPLLGSEAFQVTARRTFDYGPFRDLYHTEQVLYALTSRYLLVLSPDGRHVWNTFPGGGERLTVWNDQLAVSSREAGVHLYHIQSTGDLRFIQNIPTPIQTQQAALLPMNILAMADQSAGLRLVNANDIAVVSVHANRVVNFAEWAYTSAGHRLHIIDTATNPPAITGHYAPIHDVRDIAYYRDMIVIADGADGLKIYDHDLRYLSGHIDSSAHLVTVGENLLISSHQNSLRFYAGEYLPHLHQIGFVPLWDTPTSVTLTPDQQYALAALGPGGLAIVDTRHFVVQSAIPLSGPVQDVIVHPDYPSLFYLSLGDGRLITMDTTAHIYSDLPLAGQPSQLATDGKHLAVATGRAGLQVFSIQHTPTYPQTIATLAANGLTLPGITQVASIGNDRWVVLDEHTIRMIQLEKHTIHELSHRTIFASTIASTSNLLLTGQDQQLSAWRIEEDSLRYQTGITAPRSYLDLRTLLGQVVLSTDNGHLLVLDVSSPTAPRDHLSASLPFPAHRFLMQGDDVLAINPVEGMAHLRWSLSRDNQPELVDTYRPTYNIQAMVPLADGSMGLIGSGWFRWDGGEPQLLSETSGIQGISVEDSVILLGEDGRPYHPGDVVKPDIMGMALATNQEQVWLLRHDGRLQQIDPDSFELIDAITLPIKKPTTMSFYEDNLLIGTQNGEIWRTNPVDGSTSLFASGLGGPIHHILPELYISAGPGGLYRLDASGHILDYYPIVAQAAAIEDEWIAVASGDCGLQLLTADSLHFYAELIDGHVTAVQFDENGILALTDGVPTHYRFSPDQPAALLPQPYHPIPAHEAETAPNVLRWDIDQPTCRPISYEVWLNGELVGTSAIKEWALPQPPQQTLRWQIVTVDLNGNRRIGPEWSIYPAVEGWINPAPQFSANTPSVSITATSSPSPWWALGLLLIGMGLLGLANLLRRQILTRFLHY